MNYQSELKSFLNKHELKYNFSAFIFGSIKSNSIIVTQLKFGTTSFADLAKKSNDFFFYHITTNQENEIILDEPSDMHNNISPKILGKKINQGIRKNNINLIFVMRDLYDSLLSGLIQTYLVMTENSSLQLYNHFNHTNLNREYLYSQLLDEDEIDEYVKFYETIISLDPIHMITDHFGLQYKNYVHFYNYMTEEHKLDKFNLIDISNLSKFIKYTFDKTLEHRHRQNMIIKQNILKIFNNSNYMDLDMPDNQTMNLLYRNLDYLLLNETISKTFLDKNISYIQIPDVTDKKDS